MENKLSKISQEELDSKLQDHKTWLERNTQESTSGKQLNLSSHDLTDLKFYKKIPDAQAIAMFQMVGNSEMPIRRAKLTRAVFENSLLCNIDLEKSEMFGTKLINCDMRRVNLTCSKFYDHVKKEQKEYDRIAEFSGSKLLEADLSGCDLSKVTSLTTQQLARTNLSNSTLPTNINNFDDDLKNVEAITKSVKRIYQLLLVLLAYIVLVMLTTSTFDLVANNRTFLYPLNSVTIPLSILLVWFLPLIAGVNALFNLYLLKLWETISRLPSFFPDGVSIDKKIYPWIFSDFIKQHIPLIREYYEAKNNFSPFVENFFIKASLWLFTPMMTFCVWLFYLRSHDVFASSIHIATFALTCLTNVYTYHKSVDFLGKDEHPYTKSVSLSPLIVVQLLVIMLMVEVTIFTITGTKFVTSLTNVAFSSRDLSTKPLGWWDIKEDSTLYKAVRGVDFSNRNLRNVKFSNVSLLCSNFRGSDLTGAVFVQCDVRNSVFDNSILDKVMIDECLLSDCSFLNAKTGTMRIRGSDLSYANLNGIDVSTSDIFGVNFSSANLSKANFQNFKSNVGYMPNDVSIRFVSSKTNLLGSITPYTMMNTFNKALMIDTDLRNADMSQAHGFEIDQYNNSRHDSTTLVSQLLRAQILEQTRHEAFIDSIFSISE